MDMQRSSQLYERLGGGFGNRKLPSAATRARDTAHAKREDATRRRYEKMKRKPKTFDTRQ
jgi:hypothetical protein